MAGSTHFSVKPISSAPQGSSRFCFRKWVIGVTALVLVAVVGLALWSAPLYKLSWQWEEAQVGKNISAMEALYCWDGVDEDSRRRLHLMLLQELEYPVKSVRVGRVTGWSAEGSSRPNLEPVAQLNVVFDRPEQFQVSFLIGRTAGGACKLVIMVPKP